MASYGPGVFNYEVVILSDGNGDDYLALKKDLDNLVRFIQETTTVRCVLGCFGLGYFGVSDGVYYGVGVGDEECGAGCTCVGCDLHAHCLHPPLSLT